MSAAEFWNRLSGGTDWTWSLFLLSAFVAALLLVQALLSLWQARFGRPARRLEQRLQALGGPDSQPTDAPLLRTRRLSRFPWLHMRLQRLGWTRHADALLVQSGLPWTLGSLAGATLGTAALAALAAALLGVPLAWVLLSALAGAVVWPAWTQHQRLQRLQRLAMQLPDALDLIARAMQAGHAFSSALLLAGTEGPQPIAREFRGVFDEMHYGAGTGEALTHLAERIDSADARFLVAAVLLQSQTGGNLAQVLQSLAALMRERQRLRAQIHVLAAESRTSAWILTALPFVLTVALLAVNREFVSTLWQDPLGLRITSIALLLMVLGVAWMWHMVRIRI